MKFDPICIIPDMLQIAQIRKKKRQNMQYVETDVVKWTDKSNAPEYTKLRGQECIVTGARMLKNEGPRFRVMTESEMCKVATESK